MFKQDTPIIKQWRGLRTVDLRSIDYEQCKRSEEQHYKDLRRYRSGFSTLKLTLGGFLDESRYYWDKESFD